MTDAEAAPVPAPVSKGPPNGVRVASPGPNGAFLYRYVNATKKLLNEGMLRLPVPSPTTVDAASCGPGGTAVSIAMAPVYSATISCDSAGHPPSHNCQTLARHADVEISGLGQAVANVVTCVELLKTQNMVTVEKIETSTTTGDDDTKHGGTPKLQIWVVKSPDFDSLYKVELAQLEERRQKK
eukprot:gene2697-544_t